MAHSKKKYFSITEMNEAIVQINRKILTSNWYPDIIFSINRGGCVPGIYLSHILKISHEVLNIKQNKNKNIFFGLENTIQKNKNILIIDDINDTGKTLRLIKKMFYNFSNNIKYSALINNKSSDFKIDFTGKSIDKKIDDSWIVFPWEELK